MEFSTLSKHIKVMASKTEEYAVMPDMKLYQEIIFLQNLVQRKSM